MTECEKLLKEISYLKQIVKAQRDLIESLQGYNKSLLEEIGVNEIK